MRPALALPLLAAGCSAGEADGLAVHVSPAHAEAFSGFLREVPGGPRLVVADDPVSSAESALWRGVVSPDPDDSPLSGADDGALSTRPRMQVAVVEDLDCDGCYRVEGEGMVYTVHGGGVLGVQYGLAHLMEMWGWRFYHPFAARGPDRLVPLDDHADLGRDFAPETARRGLHLHTLHPIEGLDAVWLPGDESLDRAERIIDWTVKNRGNHLQWVALDDITASEATAAAWQAHTRQLNDIAHERGLTTGLGIQLFGRSNLQQAFDLVDDADLDAAERRAVIGERMGVITDDIGFDLFNLSFGEFFNADPDAFIAAVDETYGIIQEQQPGVEVTTVIHVGDSEDQKVTYDGEEMIYYFLATYADPEIVPWVHSVMYYNLFEDAGGAYHHEEFDAHRGLLLDRLSAGEPVGYFPESAYWVAFDNPVPTYNPLYIRSRWLDIQRAREHEETTGAARLDDHVLFSSGWEWGYWQNDYATLRLTYQLEPWQDTVAEMYAPLDTTGQLLSEAVVAVADIEHRYLLQGRLAAYLAGRDSVMDVGYNLGIVSQPERPTFAQAAALAEAERAALVDEVVRPLGDLAEELEAVHRTTDELARGADDPWVREVRDGVEITWLRAAFAHATWSAALAHAGGADPAPFLDEADALHARATEVVARRRAGMHDPAAERMVSPDWDNPTIYDYGYLVRADQLCFWERERVEVEEVVTGENLDVPGCAL